MFDPNMLDDGIREIVLLLRQAGYKTFTSCEGGRGHPFREPTVGLKLEGDYFQFRDRLVGFLFPRVADPSRSPWSAASIRSIRAGSTTSTWSASILPRQRNGRKSNNLSSGGSEG